MMCASERGGLDVIGALRIGNQHWWGRRIPLYASGFAAAAAVNAVAPLAIADWLVDIALVYVAATRGGRLETILVAAAGTGCTIAGLWTSPTAGVPLWMGVLNRMAAVGLIWLIVHLACKRNLAEAQIKVRHGLLPICACCKRIRHDDDQWQNLESYISRNSEATFTHTLCPGCFEKYHSENSPKLKSATWKFTGTERDGDRTGCTPVNCLWPRSVLCYRLHID